MKKSIIIILSMLLIGVIGFQGWVMYSSSVEEQPYSIIKKYDNVEIRHYPKARLISYSDDANSMSQSGFRTLAGYIFGGNEAEMEIAMTAPVHMTNNEESSTMSFVLPQEHWESDLPKPNSADVQIHYSKPKDVAAISFSGYMNREAYSIHKKELTDKLDDLGIKYFGEFTSLGYDPPYKMTDRRNEIIVSVDVSSLPE